MPPPLETPPPPLALAHLVPPAHAGPPPPEPAPGSPLVLQPPPPKPVSKAKAVAARAYAEAVGSGGREALLVAPAEPYDLPPPILEHELASLQAAVSEVTLEGEIGRLTLVHAYSEDATRPELTFRDAAHLRTLVQIFPGARVVAIRKPLVPSDAAEPPVDPLDLDRCVRCGLSEVECQQHAAGGCNAPPRFPCPRCGLASFSTPHGSTCPNGHGGLVDALAWSGAEGASPSAVQPSAVEPDPFEGFGDEEEDPFA